MTIIIFIIILAALVFVHELGHFLAAKACKVRVDEFALGFPPKIASFTKNGTKYSLNIIPFGGYVKIFGEDYEKEENIDPAAEIKPVAKGASFADKPKTLQIFILIAGIVGNIIFAWILLSLGFMWGMPVSSDYSGPGVTRDSVVTVVGVVKNSPAAISGIQSGDQILTIGDGVNSINTPTDAQVQSFISNHKDQKISVVLGHDTNKKIVSLVPQDMPNGQSIIGIEMGYLSTQKLSFFPAIWQGGAMTYELTKSTTVGLGQFFGSIFVGKAKFSDVTGPVGIAGIVGDAARLGFTYLLSFTAFISINLAIINLIPFPALDGGRILFVIIEKIKGSPMNQKVVQIVNMSGLALLLLLMVVVTFHDVFTLIK